MYRACKLKLISRFSHMMSEGCGSIFTCIQMHIHTFTYSHIFTGRANSSSLRDSSTLCPRAVAPYLPACLYTYTYIYIHTCTVTGRANSSSHRHSSTLCPRAVAPFTCVPLHRHRHIHLHAHMYIYRACLYTDTDTYIYIHTCIFTGRANSSSLGDSPTIHPRGG